MSVEIVELSEEEGDVLLLGFPGNGLVGAISSDYMVRQANMKRAAKVDSRNFPPVVKLLDGMAIEPINIYYTKGIYVMIDEVALPPQSIAELITFTLDWFSKKKGKLVIMVEGLAVENRLEKEKPSVYKVYNNDKAKELASSIEADPLPSGYISGHIAHFLKEANYRGIPAITVLVECFPSYPDPGAAAAAIDAIKPLIKIEIDTQPLINESNAIRLKMRELMRQVQAAQKPAGYIG